MQIGLKFLLILTVLTLAFIAFGQHTPASAGATNCGNSVSAQPAAHGSIQAAARFAVHLLTLQSEDLFPPEQ